MTLTSATSERARQRERTIQVRLLSSIERVSAARIAREFNRLSLELAAQYAEFGGLPFLEPTLEEHDKRLTALLGQLYLETGELFGARVRESAGKSTGGNLVKQQDSLFTIALRQFIVSQSATRVDEITETTRGQIRGALAQIEETGLGEVAGAKIIETATGGLIGRTRAARISRTEGHTGSQYGSQTQMDQLGLEYVKRWVSVQDKRTRDSADQFNHRSANGQRVKKGETFKIKRKGGGVEELDYPGDPSGSAGNIINCRCVQVYEVK